MVLEPPQSLLGDIVISLSWSCTWTRYAGTVLFGSSDWTASGIDWQSTSNIRPSTNTLASDAKLGTSYIRFCVKPVVATSCSESNRGMISTIGNDS